MPSLAPTAAQTARAYLGLQRALAAGAAVPPWSVCVRRARVVYVRESFGGRASDTRTAAAGNFHGGDAADRLPI